MIVVHRASANSACARELGGTHLRIQIGRWGRSESRDSHYFLPLPGQLSAVVANKGGGLVIRHTEDYFVSIVEVPPWYAITFSPTYAITIT